jgi:prepilin-type N-terminal cleavage/methylation domain-containing protein
MKNQKGFTLIELMVVIAILGILAAMVLPKMGNSNIVAKNNKLISNLRTVDGALNIWYTSNKTYNNATLESLLSNKYLNAKPTDANDDDLVIGNLSDTGYTVEGKRTDGNTIKSPGSAGYNPNVDNGDLNN